MSWALHVMVYAWAVVIVFWLGSRYGHYRAGEDWALTPCVDCGHSRRAHIWTGAACRHCLCDHYRAPRVRGKV